VRACCRYKCYETEKILYLVLELLTGGELFDTIIAKGHYSEADARQVTITLLDAIKYLHTQNVKWRPPELTNTLCTHHSQYATPSDTAAAAVHVCCCYRWRTATSSRRIFY